MLLDYVLLILMNCQKQILKKPNGLNIEAEWTQDDLKQFPFLFRAKNWL